MTPLKPPSAMLAATILFFAALFCFGEPSVTVKRTDSGVETPVKTIGTNDSLLVSLSGLCEAIGYSHRWNRITQKLTLSKENRKIVFSKDIPFCRVNDSLLQLPSDPIEQEGDLYLPPDIAASIVSDREKEPIEWDENESAFVIGIPPIREDDEEKAITAQPKSKEKTAVDSPGQSSGNRQLIKTIVIDPGHGGKDPGAIGPGGTQEKEVVLNIGLKLRDMLKKKKRLTMHMTRETDKFIPLQNRTRFANEKKADIFISIHANSIEGNAKQKETKGYKVYFLSQAKNEEDKMAALRENSVIQLEEQSQHYDNLQDILVQMAGNEFLRESQDLSIVIDEVFNGSLKKIEKLQLGIGQANFWVLNGTYMPSVLVEVGFISHPAEEKVLIQDGFQKTLATALVDAITRFAANIEAGE